MNNLLIEAVVVNHLMMALDVSVSTEVPKNPPSEFVVVEKTGSDRTNLINTATLAIQSYGATMYDAAVLNENVKEAMDDLIADDSIASVRFQSDYNYTDTSTKRYRYQAVYNVTYYEK